MAQKKTEAWLTSAVDDGTVPSAMVLAESIRKTKTTRTIAVITSRNVSVEKRIALRKVFDSVFCMDESYAPHGDSTFPQDMQAKVFAFSMLFFEKCVFVSPMSLMLENTDKLFEDEINLKSLMNKENGSIDLSLFVFKPNKELWEHLWETISQNGKTISEVFLTTWFKNQQGPKKFGCIPDNIVARFSMTSGTLLTDKTHSPIIQYVGLKDAEYFPKTMESLKKLEMGLHEKIIIEAWINHFHQNVAKILESPMATPSTPSWTHDGQIYKTEPIAIIGMSCRYPGANSLEEFWNMLYQGEEGVGEPPAFRWTKEHSLKVTQRDRKTNAGFLSTKIDEFDARFFGVSPKEAAYMDPQTRLLHEVLWESLEDSGIDPLSLYGTHTGIFTGSWMNDYKDLVQASTDKDFFRTYMGNSIGAAAARLSFLLGLTGPSIATESGCSSAIVALDLAVKSLRNGECNLAMAGGVNLLLLPFTSNIMDYVIAPNGRCKTFDSKADGFGRAEGCGVLVLKRLSDALRDGDNIWAMIRGSAVSQEGLSRSLGTPTVHCEALAMQLALEDANVRPEQVSFVETHGTGTSVGDPMEVAAITKAYHSQSRKSPLVIGSVKTNVGHTESCSGITGIMKTILAMQHELIPKHRNLEVLNPEIFLDSIPAMIPLEPVAWPKVKGHPRIAGVSSFGITGTDGHVILQEAPDYEIPKFTLGLERPMHIIKISGKTNEALSELVKEYDNLFAAYDDGKGDKVGEKTFANAAFSANVGRASFNHRAFVVARDFKDAVKSLREQTFPQGEVKDEENRQICFLFTGQGSQYQGMAKTLYDTSPVFRVNFDVCDRTLREMYNLSIRQVLWESDPSSKELSRTIYSQTSIFCVEYCLLKLWQSWGIQADYVLGHSLGEFCAAVAAGVLDFKDALKLVAERSQLIDNLPRGSMLVIKASKPEVDRLMMTANIDLDYAAANNPEQTVVAGDTDKIHEFLSYLKAQGIKAIILEASHAFHSRHMDPMLQKYRQIASTITYKQGNETTRYVSGMEGRVISDASELCADYWVRHTREKVSFVDACAALHKIGCQDFLEIGPQPILSSFVMMNNDNMQLNCLPSIRRGTDDWQTMLTSLGKLYLLGYKIDWEEYDKPYLRKKISLPFHPFHRKSFWVECSGNNATMIHPLVGCQVSNASPLYIFQNDLAIKSVPYVKDHCIGDHIVFPGAGYTEMCLSAGYCVANGLIEVLDLPTRPMKLQNLRIEAPLELKEDKNCRIQIIVDLPESLENEKQEQTDSQGFRVKVYHQNTSDLELGKWVLHASSTFIPFVSTKDSMKRWNPSRISELISSSEPKSPEPFYKRVDDTGLKFGESFRMIRKYWAKKQIDSKEDVDEIVAEMAIPPDQNKYLLHPLIIDAVFQSGILTKHSYGEPKLKVPVSVGQLTMFTGIENEESKDEDNNGYLYLHAWLESGKYYVFISTSNFTPIALIEDVELVDTNVKTIKSVLEQQSSNIPEAWEEIWKVIPGPCSNLVELMPLQPTLSSEEFQEQIIQKKVSENETNDGKKIERLVYLYILNALYELGWCPKVGELITIKELCTSLKILPQFSQLVHFYFMVLENENKALKFDATKNEWRVHCVPMSHDDVQTEIKALFSFLNSSDGVSGIVNVYSYISKNQKKILTGEMSALSILYPTEPEQQTYSADYYYTNHPGKKYIVSNIADSLTAFSKMLKAKNNEATGNRVIRVLEVGAGTGVISGATLDSLKEIWGNNYEYYFTDISNGFLTKAEKKLEVHKNVKYAIFNIEQSPLEQGIPLGYFDVVIAMDVLHATRDLRESLVNLRSTLRHHGILFLNETIVQDRGITLIFGLLEGYWRFQDVAVRPYHCCVGEQTWNQLFLKSGFTPVKVLKTYLDKFGLFVAEANPCFQDVLYESPIINDCKKWLIFASSPNSLVTSTLAAQLHLWGYKVISIYMGEKEPQRLLDEDKIFGIIYAWSLETDSTDYKTIAQPFLDITQKLLRHKKAPNIYVLSSGVHPVIGDTLTYNPMSALLFGMIKSLKNEYTDLFIRYIDFENGSSPVTVVEQILFELAMRKGVKEHNRVQVVYRGNMRYEPRMMKATLDTQKDELKLPPSSDRYHLLLPKTRMIQDLEFDALEHEEVGEGQVEIKIKAFALNFRDIFTILKPSKDFEAFNTVGLDFSGVVTKVGSCSNLRIGDRVFGANCFKEDQLPSHLVLDSQSVLSIPDKMTYWEAATLPAVFATAYYCLITIANVKKGETVLIHTGSGGVGLAAIQVAKHLGANIITTAGNQKKRAYLKSLGIEHVFHSRNTLYEKEILRVTNGKGVNVVLNSLTGPGFKEATLNTCAKNARFVEMSKLSVWTPEEVKLLRPDVVYSVIDLTLLNKSEWADLLGKIGLFLQQEIFTPLPYIKFDALNIRQALQYLQKAKHIGKVVCVMPEVITENGKFNVNVPLFNRESTYLITGGLGGIGFEVCKWMLEKGATDIVLTGRSPPKPEIVREIKSLNEMGFNIAVHLADIGDYDQCKAIIDRINLGKPLRGIQHCAGVLRDNLYANQTWESLNAAFVPKVTGTLNLHRLTKDIPLEHFVLYSSFTALVGTIGQANHVAANCFEDAFVHYRHSRGLPATSIDWGQWAQVGCAKEVSMSGVLPVSVKRMLNGLEAALKNCKTQVSFSEFDCFSNFSMLCPVAKYYVDERLLNENRGDAASCKGLLTEQFWKEMDNAEEREDKVELLIGYLKTILRSALRLESDELISETSNIQDLGVDSLMMIELKNSIQNLLGSRVTVATNLLKNCNTILELATAIASKICNDEDDEDNETTLKPLSSEEFAKLLKEDCHLDESIRPSLEGCQAVNVSEIKSILLTGVTGQLGPYILAEICKSYKSVEKITCIIRTKGKISPKKRLDDVLNEMSLSSSVDLDKVTCIQGNMAFPRFGLNDLEYNDLCQTTDAVIHCAVKSNHLEAYRHVVNGKGNDARSANVGGTLNVLKFATTGKVKRIYFASTLLAVFGKNDKGTFSDDWPQLEELNVVVDYKIPGYFTSKFVSELLIKQANERGIPCKVFRFPYITGSSETGNIKWKSNHLILRLLTYMKLKAMPSMPIAAHYLPADTCAEMSLKLFFNDQAPCEVYNICYPHPQVEQEFVNMAKDEFDLDVKLVEFDEFAKLLENAETPIEALKELYLNFQWILDILGSDAFPSNSGYIISPNTFFENSKIEKYLPELANFQLSSMDVIKKDLKYMKSQGVFEKFGI